MLSTCLASMQVVCIANLHFKAFLPSFSEFEFNKNDLLFSLRPVFIGSRDLFKQTNKPQKRTYMPEKSCYKKPQRDSPWKVLLYCNVSMDWASKALYLYPYLFLFLILLCCNADQRQFKVSFFIFGSFQIIIYVIILCAKYSHED